MSDESLFLAILLSYMAIIVVLSLGILVLNIVAYWRLFKKAGEKGWKSLIPIYNEFLFYRLVWDTKYFWITFGVSLVIGLVNGMVSESDSSALAFIISLILLVAMIPVLVIRWKFSMKAAQAYGKGKGFGVGLFFIPFIFKLIMGLDKSEYCGPQL